MASSDNVDVSLVKDSVQVVIKSLATTHKAASLAADCQLEFPNPGLDGRQMDSFIKIQNRMCGLESLTPAEVSHSVSFRSFSNQNTERHHKCGFEDL